MSILRLAARAGGSLADAARASSNPRSVEQRRAWAYDIRGPIRNHPRALAFCESPHPRRTCVANRRASKTESPGRDTIAKCIEHDGYVALVFTEDRLEYSRNWLRRHRGAIEIMNFLGVPHTIRNSAGAIAEITWPWGSSLYVFPAADIGKIDKARGMRYHRAIIEECQKVTHTHYLLREVLTPADDFGGEILLTGTPGDEIGSIFHRASSGDDGDWESHRFFKWDNPMYGSSFEERYQRGVVDTLRSNRKLFRLTESNLSDISALTREQAENILEHLPDLPDAVLREFFGAWVQNAEQLVFPVKGVADEDLYWGPDWAECESIECIQQPYERAYSSPESWPELFRALPVTAYGNIARPKRWHGLVYFDLGFRPDPAAIGAAVWAEDDDSMYEIDAAKVTEVAANKLFDMLANWVRSLNHLCNGRMSAVVIDASGPAASMGEEWRHKLTPYLPVEAVVTSPYKTDKYAQIQAFNADTALGHIKLRRNSPTDVERRYLKWEKYDPDRPKRKREVDKTAKVEIADGSLVTPGDHSLDGIRYGWCHTFRGHSVVNNPPLTTEEAEKRLVDNFLMNE